ncbi:MAG TPA: FkbM family methyltransferase [Acidimicrobiales bacterium]
MIERSGATGIAPWRLAGRVAMSEARGKVPGLRSAAVTIDDRGTRMWADLSRPFGRSLYRYGFPEPEARLLPALLRPGDVFVDGGAHLGVFTLLAAALVGDSGRVVACEPVPENYQLLQANVALNGFRCVDSHMVALSDRPGRTELFSFGPGSALGSFAPATLAGSRRLEVEVRTLDEVVGSLVERVRLVKLDIEGAELLALKGAAALLRARPDFLLELEPAHLGRQGATVDDLESLFAGTGYRGFNIDEDGSGIVLNPMESWRRPVGNPNILVSARSAPLPARTAGVKGD